MRRLLARIGVEIGETDAVAEPPRAAPRAFAWVPGSLITDRPSIHRPHPEEQPSGCVSKDEGSGIEIGSIAEPESVLACLSGERPLAYLLVYRSAVLSGDTQAIEALADALVERGIDPLVLAVSSLKDLEAVAVVRRAIQARRPDIIVTTTAFSSRDDAEFRARRSRLPDPAGHSCRQREGSVGGFSARAVRRRSRHADRPAGIRRPHRRRSHLVQGRGARRSGARLLAPGAGTGCGRHRCRGRSWRPHGCISPARHGASDGWRSCFPIIPRAADGPASRSGSIRRPAPARSSMRCEEAGYTAGRDFTVDELMPRLTEGKASFAVPLSAYRAWLDSLPAEQRAAIDGRWRRTRGRSRLRRRCLPLPHDPRRKDPRRASARPRSWPRPQGVLSRSRMPAEPWLSRLLLRPARARKHSRARASRHAWHDGVAARQGGGALHAMLAAPRHRCGFRWSIPSSSTIPARRLPPSAASAP